MAIKVGGILFFASLVVGLYSLNLGFNFVTVPETVSSVIAKPLAIVGGILLIVGGFFSMKSMSPVQRH